MADDVVFRSPALFKPYAGRAATMVFLRAAMETFEDFRYVRTFTEDDGRGHVLMFTADRRTDARSRARTSSRSTSPGWSTSSG